MARKPRNDETRSRYHFHIPFPMRRITPRTCLWPLVGVVSLAFALSIGLTFRSNHHCYAGTCGEWLFPLQARLHVIVWYMWISISIAALTVRAFQVRVRNFGQRSLGIRVAWIGKKLRISGLLLLFWVCSLYGILIGIWWIRVRDYFEERGGGLPGNNVVAAVAQTGHLADVTMGMVLLPVSRHSALASFFKLSPSTTLTFHMVQAYVLFALVAIHGALYAGWAALYNEHRNLFRMVLPVLNPTYLYHEVWPGNTSSLGVWRASLIFSGIVSSSIMLAMLFTSFPVIRRRYFNLFYFTHLLVIVAVIVICLHASTMLYCTIPGLSMWVLDWSLRLVELREKIPSRLRALGRGWYTMTVPLPRKRLSGCDCHSPLAHFYIHHSQSSVREIHPFTTITHLSTESSWEKDGNNMIEIRFLFRQITSNHPWQKSKSIQWTRRLGSLADEEIAEGQPEYGNVSVVDSETYPVGGREVGVFLRLEGPYFTSANPERFKSVVCLVAGTGLSGALAIAADFKAQRARRKDSSASKNEDGVLEEKESGWSRCTVVWTVKEKDYVPMPFFEELSCPGLDFQVYKTGGSQPRLDMSKFMKELCGGDGADFWCYISGPAGYIGAAEQACAQVKGLTRFAARWD